MSPSFDVEFRGTTALEALLAQNPASLARHIIYQAHITPAHPLLDRDCRGAVFLGCTFEDGAQLQALIQAGAAIFPSLDSLKLPYDPYRSALYTVDELGQGFDAQRTPNPYIATVDARIYDSFKRTQQQGHAASMLETLAQSIHDHGITEALHATIARAFPDVAEESDRCTRIVAIMGGHSARRDDVHFRNVTEVAWRLVRAGYLVASGGGPGIMEAANLGAFLGHWSNPGVIDAALAILKPAPSYKERDGSYSAAYKQSADEVRSRFGRTAAPAEREAHGWDQPFIEQRPHTSIAIPTWFYGHEPSNAFTDDIAKYFSNAIREDTLLAIALGGIIYAPGSAGTIQEIFMDLAQNYYHTYGWHSPMVFMGEDPLMRGAYSFVREFLDRKLPAQHRYYLGMVGYAPGAVEALRLIQNAPPVDRRDR
jgi:predicted Rossmann-fold nucleotide-binding protein